MLAHLEKNGVCKKSDKVGISGETFNLTLTSACDCDCGKPELNSPQV